MLIRLETKRITIRNLVREDWADCQRLQLEVGVNDATLGAEQAAAATARWFEWTIQSYEQLALLRQPPYGERAIISRDTGAFVGLIGLVPVLAPFAQLASRGGVVNAPFSPEVGLYWALLPEQRGQGYATEAARELAAFAFDALRVTRVVACTTYDNPRSVAVMRRIGMHVERNPAPDPSWFQEIGLLEAGVRR